MTTKRIVFTRADSGVSYVTIPSEFVVEIRRVRQGTDAGILFWLSGMRYAVSRTTRPDGDPLPESEQTRLLGLLRSVVSDEDVAIEIVRTKDLPPTPIDVVICEHNDLYPAGEAGRLQRRFRNAWRRAGAALPVVNVPIAQEIRMNEIRRERTPRLTKLDRDMVLAQAQGNTVLVNELLSYRKTLLDLPAIERPNLTACDTSAKVDAWMPTWPIDPAG